MRRASRDRWQWVRDDLEVGIAQSPVEVVQLGELYFVRDGHHRVSFARRLGWETIAARGVADVHDRLRRGCLRVAHLPSKAAERRFLERVPLPDDVRRDLWLDRPADWARLAESAESSAHRDGAERPEVLRAHRLACV